MSFADLLTEIENLPPPTPGKEEVPPPALVGFCVRMQRGMRQLKRDALASMARVSLSTVERVERGETVEPASLEKITAALGLEPRYFTRPRPPATPQEMEAWVTNLEKQKVVQVRPIKTQAQIRALVGCHSYMPMAPDPQEGYRDDIASLVEWLDLGAFLRSDTDFNPRDQKIRFRKLYTDILGYIHSLERKGLNILGGVLHHPVKNIPEWKIAVLSFSSRVTDPGAPKRRAMLVDTSMLPKTATLADCAEWIND